MAKVNPPYQKAPLSLLDNPEYGRYFEQLDYFLYLMWQRTGGGEDAIEGSIKSVIGGLDIGVDSSDPQNPIVNYTGPDNTDIINQLLQTFSWKIVPSDEEVTIGETQQMVLTESITIDGVLNIDGELSIL